MIDLETINNNNIVIDNNMNNETKAIVRLLQMQEQ